MTIFRKAWLVLRYLGPRWVCFRLLYAWQRQSGLLEFRSPRAAWDELPTGAKLPEWLRVSPLPKSAQGWGDACVAEAEGLGRGEFRLFSHHRKNLGRPPDWHHNSFTGQSAPRGLHWSALGDFDFGDIKAIWEPSRFGWAFALARAHARTGEEKYARIFWELFENWCAQNPPNEGVNWKCGQEATFRLMASTFALAQFARAPGATPARLELFSRLVIATGRRITANLAYALSQSNNHGVSECVGLLTAGLLAGETHEAGAWREHGLRELRRQLDELIYADGGFSQRSLIYHRVLLHDLLWAIALLRAAGESAPDWLEKKTRQAAAFLAVLVEPATGGAPLYGSNDGSNILPLDECAYDDLRGVLQAANGLLEGVRIFPPGPWDEAVFWLTGKDPETFPIRANERPERWHAANQGCFQWRSHETRLFLLCPTRFRHRPLQADMLQVDVWWRGRPVAQDAGSYSYNATGPLAGALAKAEAHNVPMLPGREPLRKAGPFLYLPWPRGTAGWVAAEQRFRATHNGYGAEAGLERSITSSVPGVFAVSDRVTLRQPGRVRLHWLLADAEWILDEAGRTVSARWDGGFFTLSWEGNLQPVAASLVRAEADSARGWRSRHYLAVEPAVSLELLFEVPDQLEVTTRFAHRGA